MIVCNLSISKRKNLKDRQLKNYKKQALLLVLVMTINLGHLNASGPVFVIGVSFTILFMTQIITMLKTEEVVIEKYMDQLD